MARVIKNASGYVSKGRTAGEKAANFGDWAKQHGWAGSMNEEDDRLHLFARRGEAETIDIWWYTNGSLDTDRLPIYTLAGERIKLRNVSHAAKIASEEPDATRLEKATRKRRKQTGEYAPVVVTGAYDFSDMHEDEIEQALLGRVISWQNSISGQIDSAQVAGKRTLKVTSENCKPQIHFTDADGFHAVYLDAIVSVA